MERFVHYTAHFLIMEHLKHMIATIALSVCVSIVTMCYNKTSKLSPIPKPIYCAIYGHLTKHNTYKLSNKL